MHTTKLIGAAIAVLAITGAIMAVSARGQGRARSGPRSREGALQVGDPTADFTLKTLDGTAEVQLSSYYGQRPVALIFGSYT